MAKEDLHIHIVLVAIDEILKYAGSRKSGTNNGGLLFNNY